MRHSIDPALPGLVLTLVQTLLAFWIFSLGFLRFETGEFGQVADATLEKDDDRITPGLFIHAGPMFALAYLFTPRGFLAGLVLLDGAIRLIGQGIARDPIGSAFVSLPVFALRALRRRGARLREDLEVGAPVPDEVREPPPGESGLEVLSCRPKSWNRLQTIRYRGADYDLTETGVVRVGGKKRYRFRLVPHDECNVIRRLVHYDPNCPEEPD